MKLVLLYICLLHSSFAYRCVICNDKHFTKQKHKVERALKSNRQLPDKYGDTAFEVADCYRLNGDTTYITWYKKAIVLYKKSYVHYKRAEDKSKVLNKTAYSCYYAQLYDEALTNFKKCLAFCRADQTELNDYLFYCGDCQLQLKQYADALTTFTEYKTRNDSRHHVDELIEECQKNIMK